MSDHCGRVRAARRPAPMPDQGALTGVRVLEFARVPGGSLSCAMLAAMGADVMLVELHGCDPSTPARSRLEQHHARAKRLLLLNLAHPDAAGIVARLVATIDVVVTDFDPNVATALKVDYATLARLKPGLIYMDGA